VPTNRVPRNRDRKAIFDAETLALFVELESMPLRERHDAGFKARNRELHDRLNLGYEHFCMVCSVLDRARGPSHPEAYARNDAWYRVRAVRLTLLEAAKERGPVTSANPARTALNRRLNA
jgi:hypothetical protein